MGEEGDEDEEVVSGFDAAIGGVGGPIISKYLSCDALTMRRLKSINPNKLCK